MHHHDVNNDELSETDTDNKARWFWNKSANESQFDSKEEGDYDSKEKKTEKKELVKRLKKATTTLGLNWKAKGDKHLRQAYGSRSRATEYRKKDGAKALEKKGLQSYQIGALWQQNCDLGMVCAP